MLYEGASDTFYDAFDHPMTPRRSMTPQSFTMGDTEMAESPKRTYDYGERFEPSGPLPDETHWSDCFRGGKFDEPDNFLPGGSDNTDRTRDEGPRRRRNSIFNWKDVSTQSCAPISMDHTTYVPVESDSSFPSMYNGRQSYSSQQLERSDVRGNEKSDSWSSIFERKEDHQAQDENFSDSMSLPMAKRSSPITERWGILSELQKSTVRSRALTRSASFRQVVKTDYLETKHPRPVICRHHYGNVRRDPDTALNRRSRKPTRNELPWQQRSPQRNGSKVHRSEAQFGDDVASDDFHNWAKRRESIETQISCRNGRKHQGDFHTSNYEGVVDPNKTAEKETRAEPMKISNGSDVFEHEDLDAVIYSLCGAEDRPVAASLEKPFSKSGMKITRGVSIGTTASDSASTGIDLAEDQVRSRTGCGSSDVNVVLQAKRTRTEDDARVSIDKATIETKKSAQMQSNKRRPPSEWSREKTKIGTAAENSSNKMDMDSFRGVTVRPSGKWQAQCYFKGRSRYLGVFDTRQKACLAFEAAREKLTESDSKEPIENEEYAKAFLAKKVAEARAAAQAAVKALGNSVGTSLTSSISRCL